MPNNFYLSYTSYFVGIKDKLNNLSFGKVICLCLLSNTGGGGGGGQGGGGTSSFA